MWMPTLDGVIDRRILVNYRVDPEAIARVVPPPFRPRIVNGYGLAGICLIRMASIRPRFLPFVKLGSTENAALRFAVEWDNAGQHYSGVYVPRRFSTSRLVCLLGGRFFPGIHSHARFQVVEGSVGKSEDYRIEVSGGLNLTIEGHLPEEWPGSKVFASLDEASAFYQSGSIGFSDTRTPGKYEGLEMRIGAWQVQSLAMERVSCNFFDDSERFPAGTACFDNALLMRNVRNEFHARGTLLGINRTNRGHVLMQP